MRRQGKIGISIAGIACAVVFMRLLGVNNAFASLGHAMTLPFVRIAASVGTVARETFASSRDTTISSDRFKELEARLSTLTVDYVRLRALEEENRSLQALLQFLNRSGYDHVAARTIVRGADRERGIIMIDRGARDGVETGMAVIAGEGIFIGKVTGLQERISTVTLISDERSRVAVSHAGRHSLLGILEGRGNNTARVTLIPQSEAVSVNDVIVTSGTEEKIPPNLPIGFINDIEGKPTDPFKQAALEPLIHPDRLNIVSVLRSTSLRPERTE